MEGDLPTAIGAGVGAFLALYFGIRYYPKFEKWLREWEPFRKKS